MSAVPYDTTLPTGLSVVVLNNNDVVLSIEAPWAGYQAFVGAVDKSISMVSTSNPAINDTANDGGCIETDALTDNSKIRDFVLSGLAFPQTHTIHINITYGATNVNYSTNINILGEMVTPVVKSAVISLADPNTAIVEVLPHKKSSDVNELKRADLNKVFITAVSKTNLSKEYKFDVNETGMYNFPTLSFGETYKFYAVMTNTANNKIVSAANNLSLYIVDASAFPASKLSAPIKDGSVFVTIAPIVIPDVIGTAEQIAAQRPLKIILKAAKVPANILDVAQYEPTEAEYLLANTKTFTTLTYDSVKKETSFAGDKFEVAAMTGLTLKYKAAFMYAGDAAGSYCAVQSVSVDATSIIAAPNTYASDAVAVTGLQLVGYEYSIVKDDKSAQPNVIGKWSLDDADKELIIAGSTTASSITLSAFDTIATSGLTTRPTVTSRQPTIAFVHDKKESPYYRITKRAVYAKVGDFSWANFTASGTALARAKLTLSGSDLKIDGKQWLVATKANIKSEWVEKAVEFATVALADCAQPLVDIALVENKVMATFTVSEVKSHLDFVAKGQFTDGEAAELKYYIINNTSGAKTEVTRDINDKLTVKLEILRGSKNYYSVVAEAKRGVQLVGASAELPLPNLHIIPGANRALVGSYACDSGEIKSGVLAHAAGVGASFAITYDGRFSVDQDVKDFADDHLYSADYQMSGVQSQDADTLKWSDVAGATIARVSPTDAEGKAILKAACFRITGVAGLKKHRVLLARHYALKSDATVKLADKLPVYLGFIPTVRPNTPIFKATGSQGRVNVVFANGAADSAEVLAQLNLTNDLLLEGSDGKMALSVSSDALEFFKDGLSGSFVYVAGARSYTNPNATVGSLTLADGVFVSSDATVRVYANIEAGVAALVGASVTNVYTAAVTADVATAANPEAPESYSTKFECNAPAAAGVNAEVVVFYNEDGVDKDVYKSYQLAKDKSGKLSYSLDPNQLRMDLGLTADKFMAANLKCLFTASKEYSQSPSVSDLRRSIPVQVSYTPIMKPTLKASDFSVERMNGKLKVTTGALSKVQLGGNATLNVKVLAKSEVGTSGVGEVIVLGAGGLSKEISSLPTVMHEVSVVIQSMAGLVGETTLVIGTFVPKDQLKPAVEGSFTVIAGAATSSLVASWENLAANALDGWALSTRRIYVSNVVNGKTLYYVASGNATTTTGIRTAFKSTSALTETLSGLPIGITFTVELETVYVKTGESPLIVKAEKTATCASTPVFQSFMLDKATNTVTALINQNGAALTNFWLFAKYDGAQGRIFFPITIPLSVTESTTKNHQFNLALPTTGPKPSGVMGILVNSNGAVTSGSPALTFGAPAGGSVEYNSGTDSKSDIALTLT
jgi:hypothetical protein